MIVLYFPTGPADHAGAAKAPMFLAAAAFRLLLLH